MRVQRRRNIIYICRACGAKFEKFIMGCSICGHRRFTMDKSEPLTVAEQLEEIVRMKAARLVLIHRLWKERQDDKESLDLGAEEPAVCKVENYWSQVSNEEL